MRRFSLCCNELAENIANLKAGRNFVKLEEEAETRAQVQDWAEAAIRYNKKWFKIFN